MIQAKHTYWSRKICEYYSGNRLGKAFRDISYVGNFKDNGLPVLMVANHFCWWDGFIQYRLNNFFYKRKFHVMMLEEQLRHFKILNGAGAYSIRKGSRDILKSLSYTINLLQDPSNLVLLFPQGRLESQHTPEIKLERGLDYILKHRKNKIQLIFNINLVDYYSDSRPKLNIYFQPVPVNATDNIEVISEAFNLFYKECKRKQCNPYD